ncbi:hypothetical protein RMATCC62417_06585 [Rhizopus microsporus]|nr:hypothetical protein RMATCC62417_06585 [Rhizopus microsporus]
MSANLNFGPEWMRGGFSKNVNNNGVLTDLPFEENNINAFKYSKEYMLSLYKPSPQLPSDFQQHEYVTVEESLPPLAFDELTEIEKKLLAGPVHVESTRRIVDKRHRMCHDNNNSNNNNNNSSPLSENGPNRFGRKGRDYFSKEPSFRRNNDNDLLKKKEKTEDLASPFGKAEEDAPWSKSMNNGPLNNEFFKDESPFRSSFAGDLTAGLSTPPGIPPVRKPEDIKWFYRDTSGQVQGPFEAHEMQEWYKAGFFTPTLLLRRDDESVFEPLMTIIQKVGNDDQPFLTPRPSAAAPDVFGSSEGLFGRSDKYMPFGAPTTPGGSIIDSFLSGSTPSPLYQNPYSSFGGSLLNNNRWNNGSQPLGSPAWLSQSSDLFGNAPAAGSPLGAAPLGLSPFIAQQQQQQPGLNPVFGSTASTPGLFEYQRVMNDQIGQQQQQQHYLQMLKQQQMMQMQQQFQQMKLAEHHPSQQQPQQAPLAPVSQPLLQQQQQQEQVASFEHDKVQMPTEKTQVSPTSLQNTLKNISLDPIGSSHASPVLRTSNILTGGSGWGSVPGTPLASDAPSSPWGTIGASALPSKVTDEFQPKAPGAQSPRAPSSPKKAAEKPKFKPIVESFTDIQAEEMEKEKVKEAVKATEPVKPKTAPAKAKVETKTPAVVAPKTTIISLREIQEEEMRIAKEKKEKQAKATSTASTWVSTSSPTTTTVTSLSTWSQPVVEKPLSLREIQEMEEKNAQNKKEIVPEVPIHTSSSSGSSTISWGVVAPNKAVTPANGTTSSTAVWSAAVNSAPKKTLREIQLEEELAMKKKNATKAVKADTPTVASIVASSKPLVASTAIPSTGNEGWTTVSHVRAPKPAPTPAPAPAPVVKEPTKWEPVKPAVRAPVARGPSEDFRRWCRKALRGLNSGVNEDEILEMLLSFPVDGSSAEIIEDVIYANSLRIDGKRFAQEFMRRRKADIAGRTDIVLAGLEEEDDDDFKVVTTKKNKKKTMA